MTPPEADDHPGVAKVKAMFERGDFEAIDEMVKLWVAIRSIRLIGGMLTKFIIWSGIIAGGYLALTGQIAEYIRSVR